MTSQNDGPVGCDGTANTGPYDVRKVQFTIQQKKNWHGILKKGISVFLAFLFTLPCSSSYGPSCTSTVLPFAKELRCMMPKRGWRVLSFFSNAVTID